MKLISITLANLLVLSLAATVRASDHIDGPITQSHRVADLTDFFAFPTPNKPGSLSLILNTYPLVGRSGHFSDKATYVFLIRQAEVAGATLKTSNEIVINCRFETPRESHDHKVSCSGMNRLSAHGQYNSRAGALPQDNFKVFAGMRSDPFFFNSDFATAAANKGVIQPPKNKNAMSALNVLSIALEIETKTLFPNQPAALLALATAVVTRDSSTAPLRILDRIGRPEITNVSMVAHSSEADLRDNFNAERPFQALPGSQAKYEARLLKNLSYYDGLDKKQNWSEPAKAAMAKILADDFLVIDLSKACGPGAFLEIEKSLVQGKPHQTCGGRRPADDIMDTLFTYFIAGFDGARIKDGVDQPAKAVSLNFPYLAEPDLDFFSLAKAAIARTVLGLKE